jgi:hypothetical protein
MEWQEFASFIPLRVISSVEQQEPRSSRHISSSRSGLKRISFTLMGPFKQTYFHEIITSNFYVGGALKPELQQTPVSPEL